MNEKQDFIIISAYSLNTPYEQEVLKLKQSLEDNNIKYKLYPFENQKSWEKNCQIKAIKIKEALNEFKMPVVWVDVDAIVSSYPIFFEGLKKDFSCYFLKTSWNPHELLSGTLFFGHTDKSFKLLDEWIELNNGNNVFDQKNLNTIYNKLKDELNFQLLPEEYIKIKGYDKYQKEKKQIIMHYQASRKYKDKING